MNRGMPATREYTDQQLLERLHYIRSEANQALPEE
jgi:hypothetical protein